MSISAYTGLPRSGKSYSVTKVMIDAIKEGRDVYTNIPVHADVWLRELGACPVVFDSQDLLDNPKWFDEILPTGAVLVLDECWRFWPAGLKANNARAQDKEFLAMHGHKVSEAGFTTQVILVTQDLAQLAQLVRQLVDKTFRCTKLDAVGQDGRFRVDVYQGAVTGQNPPSSQRLNELFYKYDKSVFKFYKSSTHSQTGTVGNEKRVDDRANFLKSNKMKLIVAGMVIFPLLATFLGVHAYKKFHPDPKPLAKTQKTSSTQIPNPQPLQAGFLHGRKIVISASMNIGNGDEYIFKVTDGDNFARFNQIELINAGYRVQPISECMVKIIGYGDVVFALCQGDKEAGIIARAFEPSTATKTSM